jgi:HEPN domain-containing protein
MIAGAGPYDTACFHAQQAAEKLLKGLLAFAGEAIPRTHNLEELQQLCATAFPDSRWSTLELAELTPYAVEMRYDFGFWPTQEAATEAADLARQLRVIVLSLVPTTAHP